MPTIKNIPENLIAEHINWHIKPGKPSAGGRRVNPWPPCGGGPAPGSGREYLDWNQNYITKFHHWVEDLPYPQRPREELITPWTAIPSVFKVGVVGWSLERSRQEQQLTDMSNFRTLDDLGFFLEWEMRGFLHYASATMWNEPVLTSLQSPRSTYYWQLHGLIDRWRQQWVDIHDPDAQEIQHKASAPFTPIPVNCSPLTASIRREGETDRYRFQVSPTNDSRHTVETTGPADVVIYLSEPNDPSRILTWNDDGGEGANACVSLRLPPATYYVYVVHHNEQAKGSYNISVTSP